MTREDLLKEIEALPDYDPNPKQNQNESRGFLRANYVPTSNSSSLEQPDRGGAALLEGYGKEATFGYLPQLQATTQKLIGDPTRDTRQKLEKQGFTLPAEESYVDIRDAMIDRQKQLQEENPADFNLGSLAGVISPTPVAGLKALQGLKGVKRLAASAALGSAASAAYNPGDTEGEISPLQLSERASQGATGALTGVALPIAGAGVRAAGNTLKNLSKKVDSVANKLGFKATGAALKDYRKKERFVDDIGNAMIKQKVLRPGASIEDVAEKSKQLSNIAGKKLGKLYTEVQNKVENEKFLNDLFENNRESYIHLIKTRFDTPSLAKEIDATMIEKYRGKSDGEQAINLVRNELENLSKNGQNASIEKMQEFVSDLRPKIDYALKDQKQSQNAMKDLRRILKEKIEDRFKALDEAIGGSRVKELKKANEDYARWRSVRDMATDSISRKEAKQFISLGDWQAMGALGGASALGTALASGDENKFQNTAAGLVGGAAVGLGLRRAGQYGPGLLAPALKAASGPAKALKIPGGLLEKSGERLLSPETAARLIRARLNPKYEDSKEAKKEDILYTNGY